MRAKVYKGTAVRFIAFAGVLTFLFLLLSAYALRMYLRQSDQPRRLSRGLADGAFDGDRAYADVEAIAEFGPRPPGSQAIADTRRFIRDALRHAGLRVHTLSAEMESPAGPTETIALYAEVEGTNPEMLLLCTHYDSPIRTEHGPLEGINDGASSTAWLLEMARALGTHREGRTVWLCFFDGRFPVDEWSAEDGLFGSRAFVDSLRDGDRLGDVKAVIGVDKIGDCRLGIPRDLGGAAWLAEAVIEAARDAGWDHVFSRQGGALAGDHVAFREAGIPALGVIDPSPGDTAARPAGDASEVEDTLDRVCPESLQAVGTVIYDALANMDRYLDAASGDRS